mgnify:CR=1 FL=1
MTTLADDYLDFAQFLYGQATLVPTHTPSPVPQLTPGAYNPVTTESFETIAISRQSVQANALGGSEEEARPAGLEIYTEHMEWLSAERVWNNLIGVVVDGRVIGVLFPETPQNPLRIYNPAWIDESCEAAVFAVLLNHYRMPFGLEIVDIREVN